MAGALRRERRCQRSKHAPCLDDASSDTTTTTTTGIHATDQLLVSTTPYYAHLSPLLLRARGARQDLDRTPQEPGHYDDYHDQGAPSYAMCLYLIQLYSLRASATRLLTTTAIPRTGPVWARGFCPGSRRPRARVPLVVWAWDLLLCGFFAAVSRPPPVASFSLCDL